MEFNQLELAMTLPRDLSLPMDIELNYNPSKLGNGDLPSPGDFDDGFDETIFNLDTPTSSSLPTFMQRLTDSPIESICQQNAISRRKCDDGVNSEGGYPHAGLNRAPEIQDCSTYHYKNRGYQTQIGFTTEELQGISPCSIDTRTCTTMAQRILAVLHMPTMMCLSAYINRSIENAPLMREFDLILSNNREAIRAVSRILKCKCSINSSMQLILVCICNEVVTWYRALVRTSLHEKQASDDDDVITASPLESQFNIANKTMHGYSQVHGMDDDNYSGRVIHQPLSIGTYVFDKDLESIVRVQVVKSEIQKTGSVLQALYRHMKETHFGTCVPSSTLLGVDNLLDGSGRCKKQKQEDVFGEEVIQSITTFLTRQLQTVEKNIVTVLDTSQ